MEDFEEIDLHMVPFGEVFRYAARGWTLCAAMGETKHGDWSVLMEREVAPPGAAGESCKDTSSTPSAAPAGG